MKFRSDEFKFLSDISQHAADHFFHANPHRFAVACIDLELQAAVFAFFFQDRFDDDFSAHKAGHFGQFKQLESLGADLEHLVVLAD